MNCNIEMSRYERHILAYYYHWSRNEAIVLTRSERKMWVEQIKEQVKRENSSD